MKDNSKETLPIPNQPDRKAELVRQLTTKIIKEQFGLRIRESGISETIYSPQIYRHTFLVEFPIGNPNKIDALAGTLHRKLTGLISGVDVTVVTQFAKRIEFMFHFQNYLKTYMVKQDLSLFYNRETGRPNIQKIFSAMYVYATDLNESQSLSTPIVFKAEDVAEAFDFEISEENFRNLIAEIANTQPMEDKVTIPISLVTRYLGREQAEKAIINANKLDDEGFNPVSIVNNSESLEAGLIVSLFIPEYWLLARRSNARENLFSIPYGSKEVKNVGGQEFSDSIFTKIMATMYEMHITKKLAHGHLLNSMALIFDSFEIPSSENVWVQFNNTFKIEQKGRSMVTTDSTVRFYINLMKDINDLYKIIVAMREKKVLSLPDTLNAERLVNLYCDSIEKLLENKVLNIPRSYELISDGIDIQTRLSQMRNLFRTEN